MLFIAIVEKRKTWHLLP